VKGEGRTAEGSRTHGCVLLAVWRSEGCEALREKRKVRAEVKSEERLGLISD
jgi:hypothetical protein